jgi:hypothetical protein
VSIPTPATKEDEAQFVSKCELYDGSAETAGVCQGYITSTQKCIRRDDELGRTCDGFGKFTK